MTRHDTPRGLPGLPPAHCSSCKARILWGRTSKGQSMPVDAEPVGDGEWLLERGELVHHGNGASLFITLRYRSHFATCPQADQHRKGGR